MLLVSSCNKNGKLYTVDEDLEAVEEVFDEPTRGITKDDLGNIYIISYKSKFVIKFNKDFEILKFKELEHDELHGIVWNNNRLYIADTYNDSILVLNSNSLQVIDKYEFVTPKAESTIFIDPNEKDRYVVANIYFHINDIFIKDDEMYLTMFRDLSNLEVSSQNKILLNQGFLKKRSISDKSSNLGETILNQLSQPHSPFIYKDTIYCCNSREKSIAVVDDSTSENNYIETTSFTRGLYVDDKYIYVGLSSSRSRPSSENFNIKVECKIEKYDKETKEKVKEIEIPSPEIYSIIKI